MNTRLLGTRSRYAHAALAFVAAAFVVAEILSGSDRAWPAYLVGAVFVLTTALGATVFLAIHHLTNAAWSTVVRRIAEAMAGYMPFGTVALLVSLFGAGALYEWSHAGAIASSEALAFKSDWLQMPFFAARMAVILASWILFAYLLRRESLRQDRAGGGEAQTVRSRIIAGAFLVVLAVTITAASVDWLMSIDPHFYSTLYGWYVFAGVFECGLAATAVAAVVLRSRGALPMVSDEHIHSFGKMVFAFATFWAYLWFCQFMLIYYTNMPEEGIYFTSRSAAVGGDVMFYLNPLFGWLVPFVLLMGRAAKRSPVVLVVGSVSVLLGHYIDIAIMVLPTTTGSAVPGLIDLATMLAFGSSFVVVTDRLLARAPLVPANDLYLEEALGAVPTVHP